MIVIVPVEHLSMHFLMLGCKELVIHQQRHIISITIASYITTNFTVQGNNILPVTAVVLLPLWICGYV